MSNASDKIQDDPSTSSSTSKTTTAAAGEENFKKPFLKSLNLMKPSLSLTSLPPQSPKEPVPESSSTERAYNSLKVKLLICRVEFLNKLIKIVKLFFRRKGTLLSRENYGVVHGNHKTP